MKTKLYIWMFAVCTLGLTACDQKFSFKEVQLSCTPPASSARFGVNPGPVIVQPLEFQAFNNSVTVTGTCAPGYDVTVNGKDVAAAQTVSCTNSAFTAVVNFSTGDGTKELQVSQKTDTTSFDVLDRRCFTKDTVPPKVEISGSTGAQSTNLTTVRLEGICESGLEVVISGPNLTSGFTTQCVGGKFSGNVSFTGPDGLKNVVAKQEDTAGNSGQDDKDYMIDATAPIVAITSPAVNALTRGSMTLGGTCETGVRVFISGAGLSVGALSTDCTNGQFSLPLSLSAGDGTKNLIATQTDVAGNSGNSNRNFLKDNTAPAIRITAPAANSYSTGSLALSGTCETGLVVTLSGNGIAAPQTTACAASTFSTNLVLTSPDGLKTIDAAQTDAAGNAGSDSRVFNRDSIAPIVTIIQPSAPIVSSRNITIAGACETGLQVTIDGTGLLAVATTACANSAYSIATQLTTGDGAKNLRATQSDAAGNSGIATRTVTLDTNGPQVTFTAPAANSYIASTGTLQGTCETGLAVALSGVGLAAPLSTACTGGAFSQLVSFSTADGNKVVIATQTDAVGNQGSDSRTFIKDTTAPSVTISAPNADSIYRTSLTLTGTCESGLTVNIGGAGAIATTTTCAASSYSTLVTLSANDGVKNISVAQTDAAGNIGSASRNFVRDADAPAIAIQNPAANSSYTSGLTLTGTCENGLAIAVSGAGTMSPASATCSGGMFSFPVVFTAGDGVKTVAVAQTDSAGNIGSDSRNFIRDSTAPIVRITAPAEGIVNSSGLTLVGTCESGLPIALSGAGLLSPSSATCVSSAFSVSINFTAGDGNKTISASQTDTAGNIGSDNKTYLRDSSAPALVITAPAAGTVVQSGLRLTGSCESGLVVTVAGSGISAATTTACVASGFGIDIIFSNGDGSKTISASQTDAAGNIGSDSRSFVRDTTAPAVAITLPAANSYVATNANISGTCENGLSVNLTGDISAPVNTACSGGLFNVSVTFSSGDGNKTITAAQTDLAGNSGSNSRTFIRDSALPSVVITAPAAGTVAQNGVRLEGNCENGLPVNLSGTGLSSPTTTTCTAGVFAADILFSNGDGNKNIIAAQTDAASNTASDNRTFVRDTTAPALAITSPAAGTIAQTGITLQGTCESGLNVNLSGAGLSAATSATCASGTFSTAVLFSNGDGTKTITATQTDSVGNTSAVSRNFIRDSTGPAVAITAPAAGTLGNSGLTVSGTCEAGLTVALSGTGILSSVNTTCTSGTFSAAVLFSSGDGLKNIIAAQTDLAGNTGSDNRSFNRDSTGPSLAITAPAAGTLAQTGLTLVGTCETGLNVVLSGAGLGASASGMCTAGGFSIAFIFSSGDGAKNIVATQTDAASNTASDNRSFTRDSTAPVVAIISPATNSVAPNGLTVSGTCETGLNVTINGTGVGTPATVMCVGAAFSSAITFSSGEGTKNIVASQTDAAGNTGTTSRNFIRDSIGPAVAITGPAASTVATNGLTVVGTCEAGLNVVLNGTGVQSAVTTSCPAGAFSAAIVFSSGDGAKLVTAAQADSAGNIGSDSRSFSRDSTAPVVAITLPIANTLAQTGVHLEGTCESGLTVNLGGTGLGSPSSTTCSGGAFAADIIFSVGEGAKIISVGQTDAGGNTGSDSRTFTRDSLAPAITIASPAAGTIAKTGVTIAGACETGLTVNISGSGVTAPSTTSCTAGSYSAAISFSAGDGAKAVIVAQTDAAGNTGSATSSFSRDTVAPVIAITAPAANSNAATSITLIGTCETGLIVNLSGDISTTTTACASGAFSAAVTFSGANGIKNVTASQTDAAGNTGADSRAFNKANNAGIYTFNSRGPGGLVDILFIDDNSASMEEEQRLLGDRFSNLATELSGVDWQIGITTTDCSTGPYGICGSLLPFAGLGQYILTSAVSNFVTVFQNTIRRPETFDSTTGQSCILTNSCPSGTEEGLKASLMAMNKRSTNNAGFFRDGADLAIVYLSDEDERGTGGATATTATQVINNFKAIWPTDKKIEAYSIIVRPGDTACYNTQRLQFGANANYGTFYQNMVDLTLGTAFSICDTDYTLTLRQIGQDVTRLSRTIELPQVPIPASINITYTPTHTTTFTVSGNRITFTTPAPLGTTVEITYEY